uniref:RecF/RecN/SMC N-terminal domain-containing protein n=1 Tax=Acrobeloides nanus TaxID=290746 RepID=A0A914CLZ9_9BILA
MENKPKNATQRANISNVGKEVTLSHDQKLIINEALKNEAIILSDLYDLNEIEALELIVTGELQLRNFRMLTRGLVAVICYFDTHRFYLQILKMLLILKSSDEDNIPTKLKDFINNLIADQHLFNKLINIQASKTNIRAEFDKLLLPNVKGLGGPHHQAILRDIIEDIEKTCFEVLCMMALNCPQENQSNILNNLLGVLRRTNPDSEFSVSQLAIWTAVMIFINPIRLKNALNPNSVFDIFKNQLEQQWENLCVKGTVMFAFAVSVKVVQRVTGARGPKSYNETKLIEQAIQNMAIQFMQAFIVGVTNFSNYSFSVDVMDSLIKNFICYLPEKLQEIFNLSEEEAELLALEELRKDSSYAKGHQHFKAFLDLIISVYTPNTPQIREYCEFFMQHDQLRNFVFQGRSISEPAHFIKYLETLATLSLGSFNMATTHQQIRHVELAGMFAWLNLAEVIARQDPESRRLMDENRQWNCVEVISGMLTSAFPLALKGALYRFLAALAIDEHAALRIWDAFFRERVSFIQPQTGKLDGIQRELEEKECPAKLYDCTHGFLILMKELFSKKNIPQSNQIEPYLKYITNSCLCQFAMRSYENGRQMWEMVTVALDSLYELLRRFYVTATTVQNQTSRIHVLTQLLNDSSLFRSLTQVIIETADRIEDGSPRNEFRENSALSAIRLLWIAISHRSSMADAIRNADSNIIISSLDAILLSPLPDRNATNYITLLMAFVEESDFLLNHTFYVIKILRELCCQRPSLQSRLVQAFLPHQQILKDRFAQLTSIANRDVAISPLDVSLLDLEECDSASIRGDIIRQIVELMIDSLEIDSKQNVAFLLLGFNMTNIQATRVITEDSFGEGTSCLHSFLQIIEAFITAENPFDLPYSALFEPTLRLLLKLVSFNSTSSNIMLRYLRSSNDLIYRLVTCPAFKNIDPVQNIDDVNVDVSYNILRRAIQGIILHLVALEVSTMLKSGHISEPERFYATLLFIKEHAIENGNTSANENSMIIEEQPKDVALLWDLLENSKAEAASIAPPVLEKFDPKKIDDLLKYCLRTSTLGVEQMDVEYIHFLLNMEINSIINEDINLIRSEGKEIMLYCTKYNSRRLLEAACVQLLSGWISMINVISFFAPVNFIDKEIQKHFLRDALYLLLKYARDVDMNPENLSAVSNSIFRLVRAICGMVKRQEANLDLRKVELSYILSTLLECLVLPGYSKCVAFKMDIYGSILCVFAWPIYLKRKKQSTVNGDPFFTS